MGRPGTGGGGHHSSGGHSSGRVSGGHRVGSSGSRPLGSGSSRSGRSSFGGRSTFGGRNSGRSGGFGGYSGFGRSGPVFVNNYSGGSGRNGNRNPAGGMGCMTFIIIFAVIAVGLLFFYMMGSSNDSSGKVVQSTIERQKLTDIDAYDNDCIDDEVGWLDNKTRTAQELKYFYDMTGVQPYVVLHRYDPLLTEDVKKEQWAQRYYDENIGVENGFLYVYFEEADADKIGYMAYVNGKQTSAVMDSQAVEIFWNYIDKHWQDANLSMDDVLIRTFNETADTIMKVSTTRNDLLKYLIIGLAAIIVLTILYKIIAAKFKREREKAQETIDILNTPLDRSPDEADELIGKYGAEGSGSGARTDPEPLRDSTDDLIDKYNDEK